MGSSKKVQDFNIVLRTVNNIKHTSCLFQAFCAVENHCHDRGGAWCGTPVVTWLRAGECYGIRTLCWLRSTVDYTNQQTHRIFPEWLTTRAWLKINQIFCHVTVCLKYVFFFPLNLSFVQKHPECSCLLRVWEGGKPAPSGASVVSSHVCEAAWTSAALSVAGLR